MCLKLTRSLRRPCIRPYAHGVYNPFDRCVRSPSGSDTVGATSYDLTWYCTEDMRDAAAGAGLAYVRLLLHRTRTKNVPYILVQDQSLATPLLSVKNCKTPLVRSLNMRWREPTKTETDSRSPTPYRNKQSNSAGPPTTGTDVGESLKMEVELLHGTIFTR